MKNGSFEISERGFFSVFSGIIFFFIVVMVAGLLTVRLFFPVLYSDGKSFFMEVFLRQPKEEVFTQDFLRVVYPNELEVLEPTFSDPFSRQRLVNIFEPLVVADANFKMRPALAISWGMVDDLTWEFNLRPEVKFHDGTLFDAKDVVASIRRARTFNGSGLKDLLSFIDHVQVVDDRTIRVFTKAPEPLFLQKMSNVLIVPSEIADEEDVKTVGTGPYKLDFWVKGDSMMLKRFDDYWGRAVVFSQIELIIKTDKTDRVNFFINGDADVLSFVPSDAVSYLQTKGFSLFSIPTLEVQFLLFNFDSEVFSDKAMRNAFFSALNVSSLIDDVGGFAKPVSQFVSNGVFGFNPNISLFNYDEENARKLIEESGLKGKTVSFYLQKDLGVLGEFVRKSLRKFNVYVVVNYVDTSDLMNAFKEGSGDLYFLAFKSDLADSSSFLESILSAGGEFNISHYFNLKFDELVNDAKKQLDEEVRLRDLQNAMKIAVSDDVVGVPLFEYEMFYASSEHFVLPVRLDGLLYLNDLKLK